MSARRTKSFSNFRNEATLNAICECLEIGLPLDDALNIAEISKSNFIDWVQTDQTVMECIGRSDSAYIRTACQTIYNAMRGGGSALNSKDLEAAKFVVTKRRRKIFGDGTQGIQAEQLMERPAEQLTADTRRERIRALLGVDPDKVIEIETAPSSPPEEAPPTPLVPKITLPPNIQKEIPVRRRRPAPPVV